jgi:hypothetical protein
MSIDDNDFFAVLAKAEFGCRSAFLPASRVVAATINLNPATGPTEQ